MDRKSLRSRQLRTIILADPDVDGREVMDELAEVCRSGHAQHPRLRLILIRDRAEDSYAPTLPEGSDLSIEVFDPQVQAARALLARWPPHAGMDPPYGQVSHTLIFGLASPADQLLAQLLRLTHYGDAQPVITLACEDPRARSEGLRIIYPEVDRICRLRVTHIEAVELADTPPVTGVFVCAHPPQTGLAHALGLAKRIEMTQGVSPLIHLEVGDAEPSGDIEHWDGQLIPFSWQDLAFSPPVLLDGSVDKLARVIHEHYRDSIAAQGRDPNEEPAGRAWEDLDASYRYASRHQADHLSAKLATLDCRAVREELVETFVYAPLEAERLAVIEHQRWAADRYLDGWTYAPERDNARKHHPQLIPYADLSEPMKDLDRFAVRLAPTLLARSGRGLVRMLIVAIREPVADCRADKPMEHLVDELLSRLMINYPGRGLVIASTLESDASRLVARRALEDAEAGLFLLCPRPLSGTLKAQTCDRERHDLLELVARAERRIGLPGQGEPEVWIAQRAEIGLLLGRENAPKAPRKQVLLDPVMGLLEWGFEY